MDVSIATEGRWPDDVERLLRGLPEWFGIEESIRAYVEAARVLPTTVARVGNEVVGICLVRSRSPVAAEIEVLAVDRALHRRGIGRRLVEAVEARLRDTGIALLQVKTRGPSAPSEEYSRTRMFYESLGFLALEERMDIWGPENPCLILVKPLR